MRAMASASPMASAAVELDVGARPKGQASFSTDTSMTMSLFWASVEESTPVKEMMGAPMCFTELMMGINSRVSPLLEMASRISSLVTMPKSP